MPYTKHNGWKVTPYELHHGRKLGNELTNLVRESKLLIKVDRTFEDILTVKYSQSSQNKTQRTLGPVSTKQEK